jgi:hypothetical protein
MYSSLLEVLNGVLTLTSAQEYLTITGIPE